MSRFSILFLLLVSAELWAEDKPAPDTAGYAKSVEPFFKTYCFECHTGAKPKGDFRLDGKALTADFLDAATKGKWREVVNVLNSHEMPPKKANQPKPAEMAAVGVETDRFADSTGTLTGLV